MAGMTPDELSDKQLARYYGYAYSVITANPELYDLFKKASAGDTNWSVERFQAALKNTRWWQENNAYAREAWVAETTGGADWDEQLGAAKEIVRARSVSLGFDLTDTELNELGRQYLYGGWGAPGRDGFLDQAIGKSGEGVGGEFVDVGQSLRMVAERNGLAYSDGWFASAAKSVASGLTTAQEWESEIRSQAATMFPVYADKINAGMDVYDLASPYMARMAETLELDPASINLSDSYIKMALGGVDDKGNPVTMNLWDFEKQLRKDDRWKYTKAANDQVSNIAADVLRMFGFGG